MDHDELKGSWDDYDVERAGPPKPDLIEGYRAASRAAAAPRMVLDVAYGPGEREKLDILAPGGPRAPAVVYFHGGYWRAGAREHRRFPASFFVPRGVAWVAAGYPLAPGAALPAIVDSVRRAVVFLHRRATVFGLDPERLVVAGHGAGAHLAAMALLTDWVVYARLPPHVLRGAALLSGLYDLVPFTEFEIGRLAGITSENAPSLSPLRLRRPLNCSVALGAGDDEPPKLRLQTALFAKHLRALGAQIETIPGRSHDHFSIIGELGRDGPLTRALLKMTQ
jgi:arylformamidase